jgi:hypothetical protein
MPIPRYEAKLRGEKGEIFSHFPLSTDDVEHRQASDGVTCSVCHQIAKKNFGTEASYNGNFVADGPNAQGLHVEYGPFEILQGEQTIMHSSTEGYQPQEGQHIRDSELCATCHTLITKALGAHGEVVGSLPEQMPYPEWLHSDYKDKKSCQNCHMPAIDGPVQVARVLGQEREGARLHSFIGGNFFMLELMGRYRGELGVAALPPELSGNAEATGRFLETESARVSLENVQVAGGRINADVVVQNRGGHKLPTAFPSRRAWLHFTVRDSNGKVVFESGALNADGSITGNDNDADPTRFEPHYAEIRTADQVQIYEDILGDANGRVTTGILAAARYLKDNRLLPAGFDKQTASADIAVVGAALNDAGFIGGSDRVRYSADLAGAEGPFTIEAQLCYQPIGYRWAHNLQTYDNQAEPRRFNSYFTAMQGETGKMLAHAEATTTR